MSPFLAVISRYMSMPLLTLRLHSSYLLPSACILMSISLCSYVYIFLCLLYLFLPLFRLFLLLVLILLFIVLLLVFFLMLEGGACNVQ